MPAEQISASLDNITKKGKKTLCLMGRTNGTEHCFQVTSLVTTEMAQVFRVFSKHLLLRNFFFFGFGHFSNLHCSHPFLFKGEKFFICITAISPAC